VRHNEILRASTESKKEEEAGVNMHLIDTRLASANSHDLANGLLARRPLSSICTGKKENRLTRSSLSTVVDPPSPEDYGGHVGDDMSGGVVMVPRVVAGLVPGGDAEHDTFAEAIPSSWQGRG
jgi:hypothetical protein